MYIENKDLKYKLTLNGNHDHTSKKRNGFQW